MADKMPYTMPFISVNQQRTTLAQFKRDFDMFLEEDPDFKDAIIMGARVVDDPKSINDGSVVFDCYLQKYNCKGTFTVPVTDAHDIQ